jgi:hypothetical protein
VKPEVYDNILANLGFLSGNLISCLPQKGEKEASSFYITFLNWSRQQKVIYMLKDCAARPVSWESY